MDPQYFLAQTLYEGDVHFPSLSFRHVKFLSSFADPLFVGFLRSFFFMFFLSGLVLSQTRVLAWEGPEDNKPETELLEMDDATLAWEAQGPCVKASITTLVATHETIAKRRDALRYLTTILAMKRKKEGKVPSWLYELATQAEQGAAQACMEIAKKVYLPPETPLEGQTQEQPPVQEQSAEKQSEQGKEVKGAGKK